MKICFHVGAIFFTPHGITATHWLDIGQAGDADELLFNHARVNGAILLTQDLDFTRMLALSGANLPSVIQLRVDCPIPEIVGDAVLNVLRNHEKQLDDGCLITIDLKRHRIRLLPLH
jgi:predicted nuclease of predicted toxin-antitoxin system